MTIIYTPEAVEAAEEMRDACANLNATMLADTDTYRAAWRRHVLAETAWAHLWRAGHAPHTLDVIASPHIHTTPLCGLAPGVYATDDRRFYACIDMFDPTDRWQLQYLPDGDTEDSPSVTLTVGSRPHAQFLVDLITWAENDGARDGED